MPCEITVFESSSDLINTGSLGKDYDVAVLDIRIDEKSGLDIARIIRALKNDMYVIFASSYVEYAPESFFVNAQGYVLKDDAFEMNLLRVLDSVFPELSKRDEEIDIYAEGKTHLIKIHKLMYIDSSGHYVNYHLKDEPVILSREKFGDAQEKLLKYDFVKIHRCCSVNPSYVELINKTDVKLLNGEMLPVSRALYTSAQEKILFYREFAK